MNIVVDTNVFISALIKDGLTREILLKLKYNFLFPEFEFYELKEHKRELIQKANLPEREFNILLLRLLNYVKIIPTEIIINYKEQAFNIMGSIDKDDVQFIATALAFNCPVWSDDNHFQKQNKVKILTTKDMLNKIR